MKRKIEFNRDSTRLEGPIVDWYHQLKNKKVAELEFHQQRHQAFGPRSSSNIMVSLIDGSKYLLRRRIKHAKSSLVPHFVDTIQNVSPLGVTTPPLIRVKFAKESGKCPDLLFLLSICYGAQSHGQIDHIARFFIDDEFFALAVILNITRPRSSLVFEPPHSAHNQTPLERLWKEVYDSIQKQEHTFWGHTIADEAKNVTRELIYRAARSKIVEGVPQDDNANKEINRSTAASIVARVESIIKKRDLNESNIWDNAWNKRWDAVWQNSPLNVGGWSASIRGVLPIEQISGATHKLVVEGRTPGNIAGRAPERHTPIMDGAAWLHSILMGSHPSSVQDTLLHFENRREELQPIIGETFDSKCEQQPLPTMCPEIPTNVQDTRPCLSNILPGKPQKYEIWASPREMAVHEAWAKAWPVAVSKGKELAQKSRDRNQRIGESARHQAPKKPGVRFKNTIKRAVRSTVGTRAKTTRIPLRHISGPQVDPRSSQSDPHSEQTPPIQRRRSSAAAQALRRRLLGPGLEHRKEIEKGLQDLVKERSYRENKEATRLEAKEELSSESNPPSEIKKSNSLSEEQLRARAQEAWNNKLRNSSGLSAKLNSLAEQAWQSMAEKLGNTVTLGGLEKAQWTETFKNIWEAAWKESWMQAWKAVWDDAWDAAVARGAEFGVEEVFDGDPNLRRVNYDNIKSTKAYLDVEALIKQGDPLGCLEQVHSMMKELYRLYESLQHSIPVFRDETLKITGYEKSNVPMTKKFRRRRYVYIEDRKPTHLSHYELQGWVEKRYIEKKFEDNTNAQKLFKRRIAQVWGVALSVYNPVEEFVCAPSASTDRQPVAMAQTTV